MTASDPGLSSVVVTGGFQRYSADLWQRIEGDWQALAQAHAEVPFFMGRDWVGTWLEVFGEVCAPHVLSMRRGGQWVGAGLFCERHERRGPVPVRALYLHTAGEDPSEGVCVEYDELLVHPEAEEAQSVWVAREVGASGVDEVVAGGVTEASLARLARALPSWKLETRWSSDPFVDLRALRSAGTDYRKGVLSRSTRTLVGRSLRAYEEEGPITTEFATDAASAGAMLDELIELHQAAWIGRGRGGAFASERNRAFHARLVARAFGSGSIQLVRVRVGDETIGLLYSFVDRGRVFFYQSGLRYREGNRFRPGLVTHTCAIERCLAEGFDEYHFLAGDETTPRYKTSLSNAERRLAWAVFQRPGWKSELIRGLRRVKWWLERRSAARTADDATGASGDESAIRADGASETKRTGEA